MKKKQTLAMLLAAAMVLSMPVGAYAEELDVEENASSLVEPYAEDAEAPKLIDIKLSSNTVNAGESLTVTVNVTDNLSGFALCQATFINEENKRVLTTSSGSYDDPGTMVLNVSEFEPAGTYELDSILLSDEAGNDVWYVKDYSGDFEDNTIWADLNVQCSFEVVNEGDSDNEAPKLTGIEVSKETVNAGESLTVTVNATDNLSGFALCQATFINEENKRVLTTSSGSYDDPGTMVLNVSEFEPAGTYELDSILLSDEAGNDVWYVKDYSGDFEDNTIWENLAVKVSFTVINDDPVTPPPSDPETPSNPSNPTTPSRPNSSTTTAPGTPINYESEKPDPADEQAVEVYNFWQNTKREIRVYERAGSLRVYVPADVTYMPASVMETLRVENVPVVLQWQGHRIEIPAGKAQPKQPLKAYWPMKTLCELYNA